MISTFVRFFVYKKNPAWFIKTWESWKFIQFEVSLAKVFWTGFAMNIHVLGGLLKTTSPTRALTTRINCHPLEGPCILRLLLAYKKLPILSQWCFHPRWWHRWSLRPFRAANSLSRWPGCVLCFSEGYHGDNSLNGGGLNSLFCEMKKKDDEVSTLLMFIP